MRALCSSIIDSLYNQWEQCIPITSIMTPTELFRTVLDFWGMYPLCYINDCTEQGIVTDISAPGLQMLCLHKTLEALEQVPTK